MTFITWLIALPTTILVFFFPAPIASLPDAQISTSTPKVQIIEVKTDAIVTKDKVVKTLEDANIEVHDITPSQPRTPFPVGGEVPSQSMPDTSQPEKQTPVATTIEVSDATTRKLYSGCISDPSALIMVHVKDQDGNIMVSEKITYEGSAANNPSGEFLSENSEGRFSYTIKDIEKGTIKLTFKAGSISISIELEVIPAPTDPSERPNWCG